MGPPVYIDPAEPVLLQVLLPQRLCSPACQGPDTLEPAHVREGSAGEGLLLVVLRPPGVSGERRQRLLVT